MPKSGASLILSCLGLALSAHFTWAIRFRDCWLLTGGLDDLGYTHSTNLARLKSNRDMRDVHTGHRFMSVFHPNVMEMTGEEQEALVNQSIAEGCNVIVAAGSSLFNGKHVAYANEFRNVSFIRRSNELQTETFPNYIEYRHEWFDAAFAGGAVAASVSTSCAGFVNSFEDRQSSWSHAMAFAMGYHWVKPNQQVYIVTMDALSDSEAEVSAVEQIVQRKGCDVFGRHTTENKVDKYIYGLNGTVLSMARYIDMSMFVGDTVFTSLSPDQYAWFLPVLEASFLGVLNGTQAGQFYNLTEPSKETKLTPFTAAVDGSAAKELREAAFTHLKSHNPLCGTRYRNGTRVHGFPCPDKLLPPSSPAYLDLPNVTYYDSFQYGAKVCGGGQFYSYDEDLNLSCNPCPANTFSPPMGDSRPECRLCPPGGESSVGAEHCIAVAVDKTIPIAVAAGASVAMLLVIAVAAYVIKKRKRRDNTYAPKNATQNPIAVMFTDIQASTTIWANAPEVMSQAVEDHHQIIRAVVSKHRGYEVKTIGDAFMIVHSDILSAVTIAVEIQRELHLHDWGTNKIDAIYQRSEERGSSTCDILSAKNAFAWNGLRVRIGVSYGTCEGQKDPVTGGWDYYGNIINTSARVEAVAHGGQILLSDAAYFALVVASAPKNASCNKQDPCRLSKKVAKQLGIGHVRSQGKATLRGLASPIELFELAPNTTGIMNRSFPPLRLEKDINEENSIHFRSLFNDFDDPTETESLTESSSEEYILQASEEDRSERLIRLALRAARVVSDDPGLVQSVKVSHRSMVALLSLYSPDAREKLVSEMLDKWHLTVPDVPDAPLDEYDEHLLRVLMLSVRATTVALAREDSQELLMFESDRFSMTNLNLRMA